MKKVTHENLKQCLKEYAADRENEFSEAMFFVVADFGGVYILHDSNWTMWFGVQNASARFSWNGRPFLNIRDALKAMLNTTWPPLMASNIYLSTNAETRLSFMQNAIAYYKDKGGILLYTSGAKENDECTSK